MATTYTTSLRLAQPTPGDPLVKNAWGTIENTNWSLVESAITGVSSVDITGQTTYTLSANSGSADQSRELIYVFTGALTGDCTVTIPAVKKIGWAVNSTTGGHNVILTTGSGTTTTVPPGSYWTFFWCDAVNVTFPSVNFNGFENLITNGAISGASLTVTGGVYAGSFVALNKASSGNAQMFPGDSTHPGYVAFTNASGTRVGFVGYSDGSNRLELEVEGGYTGWHVVGGNLVIDSTSYIAGSQIVTANGGAYAINITGSAGSVAWANVTGTPGQVYGLNQYVNTTSNVTFNNITANGYIQVNGSASYSGAGYTMSSSAPANVSWGPLSAGVNLGPGLWYVGYGIACSSDARVKFEIKDISEEDGVDWIMKGRPRTYIMAGRRRAGFIAQEDMAAGRGMAVMQVADDDELFKQSDGYAEAGHRLTRDYEHDVAYLTAAQKGTLKYIEALKTALQSALKRIEALEAALP